MNCQYCGKIVQDWEPCLNCGPELVQLRAELEQVHQKDSVKTKEYNILVQENRKLSEELATERRALELACEHLNTVSPFKYTTEYLRQKARENV